MLFSTIKVGNINIRNRIVMPPMCMYAAKNDGKATDFHINHYAARAMGGVGLIILEATGVEERGKITDNDLGIYNDHHIEGLSKIVAQIKAYGSTAAVQLAHAGRKSKTSVPAIISPSAIAYDDTSKVPVEMTKDEIDEVVQLFENGASRAKSAGFDMVEVHAAHGYLLNCFLSPLANKRTDEYGGSLENRARLLSRVLTAVNKAFGGPVILRVSATDHAPGGNTIEDIINVIKHVSPLGVDLINVSSGGVVDASFYQGTQIKMAEEIKKAISIPIMAGGLLEAPTHMEEIISNQRADMVYVGRALLRNPFMALRAAFELKQDVQWPYSHEAGRYIWGS